MALGKSIAFIKRAIYDREFRMECYMSPSRKQLIQREGFNENEFEDAINMQLVKCQTQEEAQRIYQIKLWFALL